LGTPHPITIVLSPLSLWERVCAITCSLRGAILASNITAGPNIINVPAGTYTLTPISDIRLYVQTNSVTINGAGATTTIIEGGTGWTNRIFDINPLA